MQYGFVIDNRKCIGCHACTTACKSEHQVPVGVNRTWVKQVEKGTFPNTRRLFSVMRCNHCTDAPCVEICPVEALYVREDGIVDFNNDRCIGCKSCMQACPYDALYIDPENHTAAKCNYCAHRVDLGLEPACVNVCPEHAIISGDMDDPLSEISMLLGREQVTTRKPEKGTAPNLFYINGDQASLNPTATTRENAYFWSGQATGVGHFAKAAEKLAFSNGDVVGAIMKANGQHATVQELTEKGNAKSIDIVMGKARRVYDVADKGILWGWEVSGYVLTKAIATGAFLLPFLAFLLGYKIASPILPIAIITGIVGLVLTGILLIKDLDRPDRFLYVLLRPQWDSWLVKGGYAITVYGGLLTLTLLGWWFNWEAPMPIIYWITGVSAVITSIYTAFLFAQAKGRDFWQSPTLALHMLIHSFMAGSAILMLLGPLTGIEANWFSFLRLAFMISIGLNLTTIMLELAMPHPTSDAKKVVQMITKGQYRQRFWFLAISLGNIAPLLLLLIGGINYPIVAIAGVAALVGIYYTEHIWVEAPQRIPLS